MAMPNASYSAQSFGPGVPQSLSAASAGSYSTPSFVRGAPIGSFNAQSFGPVFPRSFNGASALGSQANAIQRGPGVPQNLSAASGGSNFTPSFVGSSLVGAPIGSFNAHSLAPVFPQSFNAASTLGSQANAVQRGPSVFKSCQARVNIWNFMVIDNSSVKRGERLGQGAYAEVYEGKVRGLKCAVKLYRSTASQKQLKEARREIMLMASLEHPCTLRLIGWVKQPLQTITELCLGDLKDFYKDKIEGLHYSEFRALMLLRVSFLLALYSYVWLLADLPHALYHSFPKLIYTAPILDRRAPRGSYTSTMSASFTAT